MIIGKRQRSFLKCRYSNFTYRREAYMILKRLENKVREMLNKGMLILEWKYNVVNNLT